MSAFTSSLPRMIRPWVSSRLASSSSTRWTCPAITRTAFEVAYPFGANAARSRASVSRNTRTSSPSASVTAPEYSPGVKNRTCPPVPPTASSTS